MELESLDWVAFALGTRGEGVGRGRQFHFHRFLFLSAAWLLQPDLEPLVQFQPPCPFKASQQFLTRGLVRVPFVTPWASSARMASSVSQIAVKCSG